MKPRCITVSHVPKESHIIVRCEPELRQRLQRIAILERRNLSDLARIVFEDYINQQERARHLILRDTNSVAHLADAALSAEISEVAATPVTGPTNYGSKRKAARHSKARPAPGSTKKAP
jgi:hypothetical protein